MEFKVTYFDGLSEKVIVKNKSHVIDVMLERERQFYSEHHDELITQHLGKFVLVKDTELIGAFSDIDEALSEGAKRFGLTSFLVRQVTTADEKEINIPALTLGILRADSSRPI